METLYDPVKTNLQGFTNNFLLSPELWERFSISDLHINYEDWQCAKMMNEAGELSEEVSSIPTEYGGIYVYVIRQPVIPGCGEYIMYVGRALKTQGYNLRVRVRSYQKYFTEVHDREKIHRLFEQWGQYVYVRYLPVRASNEEIKLLEERLISSLVPQCNADIPIRTVKQAVNAFR